MTKTRGFLFTAGVVLAMAFHSCYVPSEENGDSSNSNGGGGRSSGDGGGGNSSPSGGGGGRSSSGGDNPIVSTCNADFKTVTIGTQTWMAENLNCNLEGSVCYNNQAFNCTKYGRLYDWETAMSACPSGWHLPVREEWNELMYSVGGEDIAGKKLKATSGWNENGNGTDEFGFSALPGGISDRFGDFSGVGYYGYWWSASENFTSAYYRNMSYDNELADLHYYGKPSRLSVRCLQD